MKEHTLAGKGIGTETVAEWAPERAAVVSAGLAKSSAIPASVEDRLARAAAVLRNDAHLAR